MHCQNISPAELSHSCTVECCKDGLLWSKRTPCCELCKNGWTDMLFGKWSLVGLWKHVLDEGARW